jgi:hypothetical protein
MLLSEICGLVSVGRPLWREDGSVEVEVTLRLTIDQYVLVSSTLVGLAIRYYFLSECCCLKFAVLFLWGALSDERTGLSKSKLLYDWRSISMSWYRAPLWDLRLYITSCRNVAVWNLLSCFCGSPSLTRRRVCSIPTQWSQSLRTRNHTLLSHLRLPQPGRPGSRIYIPQEQGGPVIHPGAGLEIKKWRNKSVQTK